MIKLKEIVTLETDRLLLRPFELNDAKDMFNNWGQDKNISKYMLWKNYESIEDVKNTIKYYKKCYKDNLPFRQYAIVLKGTNELIGSISVDINIKHHRCDIAYLLAKKYWQNGYMTEAIKRIINYAFEIGCARVCADVLEENEMSKKLLLKCGFIFEGIERKKYFTKRNKFENAFVYSIINPKY